MLDIRRLSDEEAENLFGGTSQRMPSQHRPSHQDTQTVEPSVISLASTSTASPDVTSHTDVNSDVPKRRGRPPGVKKDGIKSQPNPPVETPVDVPVETPKEAALPVSPPNDGGNGWVKNNSMTCAHLPTDQIQYIDTKYGKVAWVIMKCSFPAAQGSFTTAPSGSKKCDICLRAK